MKKTDLKLRLDAFPSETSALFILLILATLMQAINLSNAVLLLFDVGSLDSVDLASQGNQMIAALLPSMGVLSIIIVLVFGVAFFIYIRHPSTIRRHKKIISISENDRELKEQVVRLSEQAKISLPQIEMHPSSKNNSGGQAFGVRPPYSIRLDGGLRKWVKFGRDKFNAVVLHELAHIKYQDVARSYFSQAIWKSVSWCVVMPFFIVIASFPVRAVYWGLLEGNLFERLAGALPVVVNLFGQVGGMLVFTFMVWMRLLRTREYYADWQAAIWGAKAGLVHILQELTEHEDEQKSKPLIFHLHPSAAQRLDVLKHPEQLFRVSKMFSMLVGFLLASMLSGFLYIGFSFFLLVQEYVQMYFSRFVWFALFIGFVGCCVLTVGWLISYTLGTQIQKQSMLELVSEERGLKRYFKMLWPALSFSVGMELGYLVSPFALLAPNGISTWLFEILLGFPGLVFVTWQYFSYVRFISVRVFGSGVGNQKSRNRNLLVTVLTMTWLIVLFIPSLLLSKFVSDSNLSLVVSMFLLVMGGNLILSISAVGVTWAIMDFLFARQLYACPVCGTLDNNPVPAVAICKNCNSPLGGWLFVK